MTPRDSRPRLGFLGLGWIGRHRLASVADAGVADVAWLGDTDHEALRAARRLAPHAHTGSTIDEALHAKLDGLVIATPSAQHAAQAAQALEEGVAVFCQKPLGRSLPEVRRVIDAARASDRLLGVDLSYRGTQALRTARAVIAEGRLGRVFAVDATFHNAYGPDKPWFRDRRLSGGGCLIDLGTHLIDALLWMFPGGDVDDLSAWLRVHGHGRRREHELEDYARLTFTLGRHIAAHVECSWNLHAGRDAEIAFDIYGTSAALRFGNIGGSFFDVALDLCEGTRSTRLVDPPDPWGDRMILDWVAQLTDSRAFDPSVQSYFGVARIIDAAYAAMDVPGLTIMPGDADSAPAADRLQPLWFPSG